MDTKKIIEYRKTKFIQKTKENTEILIQKIKYNNDIIEMENKRYEKNITQIMDCPDLCDEERQLECQMVECTAFIYIHMLKAKNDAIRKNIEYIARRIESF